MNSVEKTVFQSAIEKFGDHTQLMVAMEEMAELQKELSKYARGNNNQSHIAEEMADVMIMLDQIKLICHIEDESINGWRDLKVERLAERIMDND